MTGLLSLAVFQSVMLNRLEMWVMTPRIGRLLGGFRNRVARRLTRRIPQQGRDRVWFYHPLEDVMVEVVLQ